LILAQSEKVLDEEESEAEVGQSDSDDAAPAQAPAIDMGVSGVLECSYPFRLDGNLHHILGSVR
jgi:hypothetical protein